MLSDKERAAELGRLGEQKVADFLAKKGYAIIKRNWHNGRYGELDIVAENDEYMVFVEVKTRREDSIIRGLYAFDERKRTKVKAAAERFVRLIGTDLKYRIDFAEVVFSETEDSKGKWKINYIKDVPV